MPKRDSKGQQVKSFKHFIPLPNSKLEEAVVKVYFQAAEGQFVIFLPEHIAAVASGLPSLENVYEANGAQRYRGEIRGAAIDPVIAAYKHTLASYKKWTMTLQREKVIGINFKHNIRWIKGFHDVRNSRNFAGYASRSGEISFVGNPAIHLKYEILWRVDGKLYRLHNEGREDEYMDYYSGGEASHVIPWTAEREAFFANTVGNIERLIMAMIEFFDDIEGNVAKAIAGKGPLALPPKSE